ncbi:MAG: hypothetical protein MI757_09525, partial [Pirellulales bacterium]|nr:hypothetical protein [Pirellulales bacterium]
MRSVDADGRLDDRGAETDSSRPAPRRRMPAYIEGLYRTRLLDRDEEVELFTRLSELRAKIEPLTSLAEGESLTRQQSRKLKALERDAVELRNRIVEANLRLVVSIAKKFASQYGGPSQPDIYDFVSEGNEVLLRAVDRFD